MVSVVKTTGTNSLHQKEAFVVGALIESAIDGVTAAAGGGRPNAVLITNQITRVTTVASGNDSLVLPPAAPGVTPTVINAGANSLQIFANGSDTIDGTAGSVGVALAAGKTVQFYSAAAGSWHRLVSA